MTPDLRYPIGRFARPANVTASDRAATIEALAALPGELRDAVRDLSNPQLDTPYRPEGWTLRQVVHHLADSHMNAYIRTRWALTEDNPTIKPYDENAWAALADARTLPPEPSLLLLDGIHGRWVTLLRTLEPDQFDRAMVHPQSGPMSIDVQLALYAWHGRHHVAHLAGLRMRSGW